MENRQIQVTLIRHAQSEFNLAQMVGKGTIGQEVKELDEDLTIKFSDQLFDCNITEEGVNQCKQAQKEIQDMNFDIVLISPLLRALKTADILFENCKQPPTMIIHPLFREHLLSNCDIGSKLSEIIKDHPKYNFDFVKKYPPKQINLWSLYECYNENIKKQLLEEIQKLNNNDEDLMNKNGPSHMLAWLKNNYPNRMESNFDLQKRVQDAKNFINDLVQKFILENNGKIPKIAIVSHSRFFLFFQNQGYDQSGWPLGVLAKLKNCIPNDFTFKI